MPETIDITEQVTRRLSAQYMEAVILGLRIFAEVAPTLSGRRANDLSSGITGFCDDDA